MLHATYTLAADQRDLIAKSLETALITLGQLERNSNGGLPFDEAGRRAACVFVRGDLETIRAIIETPDEFIARRKAKPDAIKLRGFDTAEG